MDPTFGRWLKICNGRQAGELRQMLRLNIAFDMLFPGERSTKEKHHDAGYDAEMTRKLYVEALIRLRSIRGAMP